MSGQRALPAQDKGRGSLVARDNAGGRKAVQARRGLFKNGRLPSMPVALRRTCAALEPDMASRWRPLRPWAACIIEQLS